MAGGSLNDHGCAEALAGFWRCVRSARQATSTASKGADATQGAVTRVTIAEMTSPMPHEFTASLL